VASEQQPVLIRATLLTGLRDVSEFVANQTRRDRFRLSSTLRRGGPSEQIGAIVGDGQADALSPDAIMQLGLGTGVRRRC
jgi:hypothetical protein